MQASQGMHPEADFSVYAAEGLEDFLSFNPTVAHCGLNGVADEEYTSSNRAERPQ